MEALATEKIKLGQFLMRTNKTKRLQRAPKRCLNTDGSDSDNDVYSLINKTIKNIHSISSPTKLLARLLLRNICLRLKSFSFF
jgi:hypothetical protein